MTHVVTWSLRSRRSRLVLLLVIATAAISVLAFRAAGSSVSYYVTPEEFTADDPAGERWRIGGRVVDETIEEENGRPVAFAIAGESGTQVDVTYDGVVPGLFGPYTFVVVDGTAASPTQIDATSVIIKHENEFFDEAPPDDSISSNFVPTVTPAAEHPAE